jgi:exonuclease SbcC
LTGEKVINEQLLTDNRKIEEHLNDLNIYLKSFLKNIKLKELKVEREALNEHKIKLESTSAKLELAKKECENFIKNGINKHFNKTTINSIYKRISPHPYYEEIDFNVDFNKNGKPYLKISALSNGGDEPIDPLLYMSSGQINVLSLSVFLAKALNEKKGLDTIFMDDPIQNLSDINVLSFIDLLRTLTTAPHNRQIVISTHDENFFKLLKFKLPEEHYSSRYLELVSFGKLKKPITENTDSQ